jgi:allophanate hydrolase
MIRSESGASIEIEVWELEAAAFGMFGVSVPPPLLIGNVKLVTGEWTKGFLCEEIALVDAREITSFGGWRAYLTSLQAP